MVISLVALVLAVVSLIYSYQQTKAARWQVEDLKKQRSADHEYDVWFQGFLPRVYAANGSLDVSREPPHLLARAHATGLIKVVKNDSTLIALPR